MDIEGETFDFVTEDEEYLSSVYFANSIDSLNHSYMVMCRDHNPENADDRIYIECGDQIWFTYDGILKCRVSENDFYLEFDETAARELGGVTDIRVSLKLSDEQRKDFYSALKAIFHGKQFLNVLNNLY